VKIFITQKLIAVWIVVPLLLIAAPRFTLHAQSSDASTARAPISVAILDFSGDDATANKVSDTLSRSLLARSASMLQIVNRDLTRAAARGAGYSGSLNLTRTEARDLGNGIGCDFYLAGRAETLRRSSSTNATYYEAYAGVFLISTRTGRLVLFDFTKIEAPNAANASAQLHLALAESAARIRVAALRANEDEAAAAARIAASAGGTDDATVVVEDAPENTREHTAQALRPPQPYRRIRPVYTEQAMRASVEATIDVAVEINADGAAGKIEVERWAGFGLDEAVIAAIRAAHFRPATRRADGEAVPMRVLLRYNFRSPAPQKEAAK
jgi:TonB family protein